jgi:type I restriction enzyme M protein
VGEQISHDPDELLKKYREQQEHIGSLRDKLKAIIGEALNAK